MAASRVVLLAAIALVAFPAGIAAPVAGPPVPEKVVEGHTVYAVLQQANGVAPPPYAAGPASRLTGLPPLPTPSGAATENAVRWLNDQDLVPSGGPQAAAIAVLVREVVSTPTGPRVRTPCTGAVLATDVGNPDPRASAGSSTALVYVESYRVRDPNQRDWTIDLWRVTDPTWGVQSNVAAVSLGGDPVTSIPDDGVSSCHPVEDRARAGDAAGRSYPDGSGGDVSLEYNALLYLPLDVLRVAGAHKDHRDEAPDRLADVAGCDVQVSCPGGSDDREGNSHPYGFYQPRFPSRPEARPPGDAPACGEGGFDGCHPTRLVDLYYAAWPSPLVRTYRVVDDVGWSSRA